MVITRASVWGLLPEQGGHDYLWAELRAKGATISMRVGMNHSTPRYSHWYIAAEDVAFVAVGTCGPAIALQLATCAGEGHMGRQEHNRAQSAIHTYLGRTHMPSVFCVGSWVGRMIPRQSHCRWCSRRNA